MVREAPGRFRRDGDVMMRPEQTYSVGRADASLRVLWLHGYTGSPGAFRETAEHLAHALDAFVYLPLLPGHGTDERDLLGLPADTFFAAADDAARLTRRDHVPFVVLGYSFGSYLATAVAQRYAADGLVLALTPYLSRFPGSLPGFEHVMALRTFWDKHLTAEDLRDRAGTFYYPDVPGTSLALVKHGNDLLREIVPGLPCPILTFHNTGDPVVRPESGRAILALREGGNPHDAAHVFPGGRHTLFFRPSHEVERDILTSFLRGIRERYSGNTTPL